MVSLQPCGVILLIIALVIFVAWVSANAWARGFVLAYEGCQAGAFDADASMPNGTYTEGLAYASKNPPFATQVKKAEEARAAAKAVGGEGFVYRNTDMPQAVNTHAYAKQEGFTRFDYVLPSFGPSPAQLPATPTSPFVGHL